MLIQNFTYINYNLNVNSCSKNKNKKKLKTFLTRVYPKSSLFFHVTYNFQNETVATFKQITFHWITSSYQTFFIWLSLSQIHQLAYPNIAKIRKTKHQDSFYFFNFIKQQALVPKYLVDRGFDTSEFPTELNIYKNEIDNFCCVSTWLEKFNFFLK